MAIIGVVGASGDGYPDLWPLAASVGRAIVARHADAHASSDHDAVVIRRPQRDQRLYPRRFDRPSWRRGNALRGRVRASQKEAGGVPRLAQEVLADSSRDVHSVSDAITMLEPLMTPNRAADYPDCPDDVRKALDALLG
jgi:hypothetical protein